MTDEAMSPLRRRMIEDMTIRKLAPKTQRDYVQRIKNFAAFLGRPPDTATFEDVRRYQLHLAASGVGAPTLNQAVSTLRFFFRVTLRRHDIVGHTHFIREARKLPAVLSPEEVARLLDAAPGLKYKAALSVAYVSGFRPKRTPRGRRETMLSGDKRTWLSRLGRFKSLHDLPCRLYALRSSSRYLAAAAAAP
jgi:integrase/recombinase XerD